MSSPDQLVTVKMLDRIVDGLLNDIHELTQQNKQQQEKINDLESMICLLSDEDTKITESIKFLITQRGI